MTLEEDHIVDIKESQLRYFGGPGKMLLPSQETVAALLAEIPERQLLTTDLLRKTLAARFQVQGTCPVTTKKALKAIANNPNTAVAYWRVIKQNGELMNYYPGGVKEHVRCLQQEGFAIDDSGKAPRVENYKASLARLE
ncbi:MAG: MGMT family protein [Anaerolineales bacterium]|nr:MGMT family protein [Anaerolineales bacterium]